MLIPINVGLSHLKHLKMSILVPLQGELKILSPANYERLKKSILEKGFCYPMFVWPFEGQNFILDGHQRQNVYEGEGWSEQTVPCVEIHAETLVDAKEKLLVCTSQYGTVTVDGLRSFVDGMDWNWVDDFINFDAIPVLDFTDIKDPDNYDLKQPESTKPARTKEANTCKCPNCGHEFTTEG
ncbi:ParB N-terminal domain-containing protein [Runella sp.]|uniref:ParB N-terminal domain-containing protein n=1 Tax=Runella sp. TaxID=1960881 RepID=UPI003D09C5A1